MKYISRWFKERPKIQKALIEYRLEKCRDSENFDWCMRTVTDRWFYINLPDDYGLWCLEKAKSSNNEIEAHYLFMECVRTFISEKGNAGLTLDLLVEEAARDERLNYFWEEARFQKIDFEENENKHKLRLIKEKQKREKQEYLKFFKSHLQDIKQGSARPGIFNDIVRVFNPEIAQHLQP